jgi:hypothetical protein
MNIHSNSFDLNYLNDILLTRPADCSFWRQYALSLKQTITFVKCLVSANILKLPYIVFIPFSCAWSIKETQYLGRISTKKNCRISKSARCKEVSKIIVLH